MDSIMKKTAFIIGLISLLTACNSGSDDRFMELPDTPAGKSFHIFLTVPGHVHP